MLENIIYIEKYIRDSKQDNNDQVKKKSLVRALLLLLLLLINSLFIYLLLLTCVLKGVCCCKLVTVFVPVSMCSSGHCSLPDQVLGHLPHQAVSAAEDPWGAAEDYADRHPLRRVRMPDRFLRCTPPRPVRLPARRGRVGKRGAAGRWGRGWSRGQPGGPPGLTGLLQMRAATLPVDQSVIIDITAFYSLCIYTIVIIVMVMLLLLF